MAPLPVYEREKLNREIMKLDDRVFGMMEYMEYGNIWELRNKSRLWFATNSQG